MSYLSVLLILFSLIMEFNAWEIVGVVVHCAYSHIRLELQYVFLCTRHCIPYVIHTHCWIHVTGSVMWFISIEGLISLALSCDLRPLMHLYRWPHRVIYILWRIHIIGFIMWFISFEGFISLASSCDLYPMKDLYHLPCHVIYIIWSIYITGLI